MTDIDTYNDHCERMTMHQQSRLPRRGVRIPTIIMILFLLVVFGALAFGQNVTITRLDGSTLMIPSTIGGTRAAPVAVAPNLVAWSFPGGIVLENPGANVWESKPGAPFEFLSLTSDVGIEIKATDPKRDFATHRFLGGEWWPFLTALPAPPSPADTQSILALIGYRYDLGLFARYPRLDHVAKLFGDSSAPKVGPTGQHDLGWLMRFWKHRTGGPDLVGLYQTTCTQGDGYDNWHYDQLAVIGINWMRTRRDSDFLLGFRMALAQACWGVYHNGKWKGYFAYEKSGSTPDPGFVGRGQIPDWGKQWFAPLVLWWLLSDRHPLIGAAIEDHLELLRRTPANWWGGDWGERRPARYLESLEVAYLLTGDPVYQQKAVDAVAQVWKMLDASGLWVNKGSPDTTSPWMHAELIYHLATWQRLGVTGGDLRAVTDRVLARGTFEVNGKPGVWYRFGGPEKARGSAALNGFILPMLRLVRPEHFDRWADATYGPMLAASWAQIQAGVVPPIQDVGIEYGPQGMGWKKACLELLTGMKR